MWNLRFRKCYVNQVAYEKTTAGRVEIALRCGKNPGISAEIGIQQILGLALAMERFMNRPG